MSENEWIEENLRRIINSDRVEYVNREGKSANYEDERDDVISTIESIGLAKCDNFGGVLMSLGETIRDEYNGSYITYLESIDLDNRTNTSPTRKRIMQNIKLGFKFIGWLIMVAAATFAIIEFLF